MMSLYTLSSWIPAILILSLCLVITLGSNNRASRSFALSIALVAFWLIATGFFYSTTNEQVALILIRSAHYFGSIIAASFLYFFISYPEDSKPNKLISISIIVLSIILIYPFILSGGIIHNVTYLNGSDIWAWNFGPLIIVFELTFFGFFAAGISILYNKYKRCRDANVRRNLGFMLYAQILGALLPGILCILLPLFGYFDINWLGPASEIIWIPIIAYSIIRYRQMDVRTVAAEVLAIAMTIIFFINIFVNSAEGIWKNTAIFVVFLVLAIFLIRGVLKEAKQKEQLATLNARLEEKVAEQTKEIRKAYELEKHARHELEKLNENKDQFIMITQHHLRTPLTVIEWSFESLFAGAYGVLTDSVKNALTDAKSAVLRLKHIIDDFLNITALKAGQNILNITNASLLSGIEDNLRELKLEIEKKRLKVTYPRDTDSWQKLDIDEDKMRDITLIVLENAVKYNRDGGTIDIRTNSHDGIFELEIENSGIGISADEADKIGTALFYRGIRAREMNAVGMGVGLSVVKAIVKAHKGTFAITSKGENKGAIVRMTVPINRV